MNTVSFQNPEEESKVIPLDSSDRQSWNSSKLGSESDPAADDCFGAGKTGKHEAQESSSLMSLSNENGAVVLDSRSEQVLESGELVEAGSLGERELAIKLFSGCWMYHWLSSSGVQWRRLEVNLTMES
uniref:Uncharacterized protein n=1 Tax=Sphaerodactylus townsendi TaxID=933632 RepID=A0ACB8EZP7_9SAUR